MSVSTHSTTARILLCTLRRSYLIPFSNIVYLLEYWCKNWRTLEVIVWMETRKKTLNSVLGQCEVILIITIRVVTCYLLPSLSAEPHLNKSQLTSVRNNSCCCLQLGIELRVWKHFCIKTYFVCFMLILLIVHSKYYWATETEMFYLFEGSMPQFSQLTRSEDEGTGLLVHREIIKHHRAFGLHS